MDARDASKPLDDSARFPFLARVGEASRRALRSLPVRRAPPSTQVLHRGAAVDGMFLLTDGALRVYHLSADGREVTLYRVEPGETCILALTAAYRAAPYPAWVETDATGAGYVLVPRQILRALIDDEPALRDFVFEALSGRVFELMARLAEASVMRLEARLASLLSRRADARGDVRMTQAALAAELGTAREVVFRGLRALESEGLVETHRARVRVLRPDELSRRGA